MADGLDARTAAQELLQADASPSAATKPARPCPERAEASAAGSCPPERRSGATSNGAVDAAAWHPAVVEVFGPQQPPTTPRLTDRRLESDGQEAWRQLSSGFPRLTDLKLDGDVQAFLANCEHRLQGAEEALRRDGDAVRALADDVADRLGRRVDERLRELQAMELRLSGQLFERLESGSKATEELLNAHISERFAAFEDESKAAERRLIATAEARALAVEVEAKALALKLSAQITERLTMAQAEINGTQILEESKRGKTQENIVEVKSSFSLQLEQRCKELEARLADIRRQMSKSLDERCSELDEKLAEVVSVSQQRAQERGAPLEQRLAEAEDAFRHLLDERLTAAQLAATEQCGQLEHRIWSWQEDLARRTISTERALAELRREWHEDPFGAALQRVLPEAMRDHTRELAKAGEVLRLKVTELEGTITRRAEEITNRIATTEQEAAKQIEALARSASETRMRVEEVARQHAQRLALAELMHQRLEGRTVLLDERLQALESNEVVCRSAPELGQMQRRMLQLADGADDGFRAGEREVYDTRPRGGGGGGGFDGKPRAGGGGVEVFERPRGGVGDPFERPRGGGGGGISESQVFERPPRALAEREALGGRPRGSGGTSPAFESRPSLALPASPNQSKHQLLDDHAPVEADPRRGARFEHSPKPTSPSMPVMVTQPLLPTTQQLPPPPQLPQHHAASAVEEATYRRQQGSER